MIVIEYWRIAGFFLAGFLIGGGLSGIYWINKLTKRKK